MQPFGRMNHVTTNNVNRAGLGPSIRTEDPMARVATEDQYVEDTAGIRRLIKKGDQVPPGLFDLSKVATEEVDVRTLARPVIDEASSQPGGTAAEPLAGVSHERAAELQANAREGVEPPARGGRKKASG